VNIILKNKQCKNHKLLSLSLFSVINSKSREKSYMLLVEGTMMLTSRLAYKIMSSLQDSIIETCWWGL